MTPLTEVENLRAWLEPRRETLNLKEIARKSSVNYTVLMHWLKGINNGKSPRKLSQTDVNNLVTFLEGLHGYKPLTNEHNFL